MRGLNHILGGLSAEDLESGIEMKGKVREPR
jgi:hypothetical protein